MGIPPLPLLQSSVGHRPERKRLFLALAPFIFFFPFKHHQLLWLQHRHDVNVFSIFIVLFSQQYYLVLLRDITVTTSVSVRVQCIQLFFFIGDNNNKNKLVQ
jgi:hypothetical protein